MTETDIEYMMPEEAQEEIAKMNENRDGPLHDPGHLKHSEALERLEKLLVAVDAPPVERIGEDGQHTTADLENIMAPALEPPDGPEDYTFDAFDRSEGDEWDQEQEGIFRQIFYNAEMNQGEADTLMAIASSGVEVDADRFPQENRHKSLKPQSVSAALNIFLNRRSRLRCHSRRMASPLFGCRSA